MVSLPMPINTSSELLGAPTLSMPSAPEKRSSLGLKSCKCSSNTLPSASWIEPSSQTQIGQRLNNALAAIEDANLRLRGVFGDVDFANRSWHWRQEVVASQVPGINRIDVKVRPKEVKGGDDDSWYVTVSGLAGNGIGLAGSSEAMINWDPTPGNTGANGTNTGATSTLPGAGGTNPPPTTPQQ